MREFRRPWIRVMLLALAAAFVPACGDDSDDDPAPPPAPNNPPAQQPTVLFQDDFGSGFPATSWTSPSSTGPGPTITLTNAEGNPVPALAMTTTMGVGPGPGPVVGWTDCTTSVTGAPFTASAQMQVPDHGEGSGSIGIFDGLGNPLAAAEWHPTSSFGGVTFMISGAPSTVVVAPPSPGSTFRPFSFSVDSTGLATWSLNGSPVMSQSGFPAGPYRLRLYIIVTTASGPFATFNVDNVLITAP